MNQKKYFVKKHPTWPATAWVDVIGPEGTPNIAVYCGRKKKLLTIAHLIARALNEAERKPC